MTSNKSFKSRLQQVGYPLGESCFLVIDAAASSDRLAGLTLATPIVLKALELTRSLNAEADIGEPIPIPEGTSAALRGALHGATLLFASDDAILRLDWSEWARYDRLGVTSLIMHDIIRGEGFVTLRMAGDRAERDANLSALREFSLADCRLEPQRAPEVRLFAGDGKLLVSETLSDVELRRGAQMCWDHLVFEGDRPLPPLEQYHQKIRESGGGLYSIFNQQLYASETEPGRAQTNAYWVVRRTPETEPLLPVVADRSEPFQPVATQDEVFGEAADADPPPVHLQPGDHVVVCTHALASGGAERQWALLAQQLARRGFRVSFLVFEPLRGENRHYLGLVQDAGVEVIDANLMPITDQLRWFPRSDQALAQLATGPVPFKGLLLALTATLRQLKPKAVFTQLDSGNLMVGFAAALAGVDRVVLSFRNYNPTHFPYLDAPWLLPAYHALAQSPRVLYSGNHRGANDDYAAWIGIDPNAVRYIPNAVDPEQFGPVTDAELRRVRKELGLRRDQRVILGVFRISDEKDPWTFVETAARVLAQVPDAVVLHAGGGATDAFKARLATLGLDDRFHFLGRRADVSILMKIANLLLLTSKKEGMPNVVAEAQLMGLPVVATRAGGTGDVCQDGVTAILASTGDTAGLATACVALLGNPTRASAIGRAGARWIRSSFPKSALADRYVALVNGQPSDI